MRAIKAVLLMAGEIKRAHIKDSNLTDEQSEVKFSFIILNYSILSSRKGLCYKH